MSNYNDKEERDKRRKERQERIAKRAEKMQKYQEGVTNTVYNSNRDYSDMYVNPLRTNEADYNYLKGNGQYSNESVKDLEMSKKRYNRSRINEKKNNNKQNNKKTNSKKNNNAKKKKGKLRKFIDIILILILLGIAMVAYVFFSVGKEYRVSNEDLLLKNQNTEVFDSEGTQIATLSLDEKRKVMKLSEMSEFIPNAFIAIEDQRFYNHRGIDPKRTIGAVANYVIKRGSSSYGGSTITQQLVKNMTKDDERNWKRKVREMVRARQIEDLLSKDEIMELYLNLIYVGGNNIHGIALGSDYYFSKNPKDITLEEAAYMAGINHIPANYNPFITKKDDESEEDFNKRKEAVDSRIKTRVKTVLGKMLELGKITKEQYDEAATKAEKGLEFKQGSLAQSTVKYSYIVDAAIQESIDALVDVKNMSPDIAEKKIYSGGYKIYTTQKTDLQNIAEEEMKKDRYIKKSRKNKDKHSQAAAIFVDNETGAVVSAVGGLGEEGVKITRGDWNRVTRTKRQMGSSMKPIGVVCPGLETKKLTAASTFNDAPFKIGSWNPKNYTRRFKGWMTIREAIKLSQNIPNVKALQQIGIETSYNYLKSVGIPVVEQDKTLGALALGGLTQGATVTNAVGAYQAIANNGEYIKPHFVTKLENQKGEEIYKPNIEAKRVLSKQNAFIAQDILLTVVRPGGTAPYCSISGVDVGAKTGTSNDDVDRWLCGFSPKYTGAVWYGFDEAETVHFSGNPAGQIFSAILKKYHKDNKNLRFEKPDGIVEVNVCNVSGKLPTGSCSSDARGSRVYKEYFVKGTEPTEKCDKHVIAEICTIDGLLATDDTLPENRATRGFIDQPEGGTEDSAYRKPTSYSNAPGKKAKEEAEAKAKAEAEAKAKEEEEKRKREQQEQEEKNKKPEDNKKPGAGDGGKPPENPKKPEN